MLDPSESWIEQWVLHEATECYNYYSCVEQETNHNVRAIWERFLDYELGHFHMACDMLKQFEKRDPAEIITSDFSVPLQFRSQREFVRKVLASETGLSANGTQFVPRANEGPNSTLYRNMVNTDGSPSEAVATGYVWTPGTELTRRSSFAAHGAIAP
jgi:hypothetical protein